MYSSIRRIVCHQSTSFLECNGENLSLPEKGRSEADVMGILSPGVGFWGPAQSLAPSAYRGGSFCSGSPTWLCAITVFVQCGVSYYWLLPSETSQREPTCIPQPVSKVPSSNAHGSLVLWAKCWKRNVPHWLYFQTVSHDCLNNKNVKQSCSCDGSAKFFRLARFP